MLAPFPHTPHPPAHPTCRDPCGSPPSPPPLSTMKTKQRNRRGHQGHPASSSRPVYTGQAIPSLTGTSLSLFLYPFHLLTSPGPSPFKFADSHKRRPGSILLLILAWDIQSPCTPAPPVALESTCKLFRVRHCSYFLCPILFFWADTLKIV
jgi:hypothetical protein